MEPSEKLRRAHDACEYGTDADFGRMDEAVIDACARIVALEQERDELLASCDDHTAHVNEYEEAIEERDRLGKHLNKYGQHLEGCSWDPSRWNDGPTPCDCGLHRALAGGEAE